MSSIAPQMTGEDEGGFIALMRHRNYALLWTGQLISHLGDRFHWVAISLWVYAQTGSALSVSYAIMALMVAPALVGFYAGALVDRLQRRKIMVVADLVRAGLVAGIPWLMEHGIVWVYLDLFLVSAASAFFRPAMFAAIPQSVPKDSLLQANAFFASMDSANEVVGPALAGLLVARLGYAAALYVDAASYLVSAAFVAALRLAEPGTARGAKGSAKVDSVLQSIREGLRYVRGDRVQVALLALLFAGQWVVGLSSLQTPLAKGVLGITDRQYGWFQSIWGMGFVGASLLLGWYGRHIPKGQAIVCGYLLWALAAGAMAVSANYVMLVVSGFWVGFANIMVFINVGTVMMEHTPSDKIGRAVTVRQIGVSIVRVIALLGFGWLADLTSVRAAILAMAGVSLVGSAAAAARFRALWQYRVSAVPLDAEKVTYLTRRLTEPIFSGFVSRFIAARSDPEFVVSEQRWLNVASLLIIGIGWILLLVVSPARALGIAGAVIVVSSVAVLARALGQRLRQPSGGHDRSKQ